LISATGLVLLGVTYFIAMRRKDRQQIAVA
jgi:hypothetical protein